MIAIVTDSTICITRAQAKGLSLHIVPQSYTVGGSAYSEGYEGENGAFLELLAERSADSKTAHAGISPFRAAFDALLERGFEILAITMSSRLSGVYSAAVNAAREIGSDKIRVVDSLSTAGGLALIAAAAREYEQTGKSLEETARYIENIRSDSSIIFSVSDLDALRRSGRIGFVRQSVSTILNLRPVLLCSGGTVVSRGVQRGQNALIERMASAVPREAKRAVLMYAGDKSLIPLLQEELCKRIPEIRISQSVIGPVLCIHLGIDVFGVAWL